MKIKTYRLTWGPKYDMDAYMASLFGVEARDLCWMLGQAKTRPDSQHKSWGFSALDGGEGGLSLSLSFKLYK